jgi:hypothetical protein
LNGIGLAIGGGMLWVFNSKRNNSVALLMAVAYSNTEIFEDLS